MSKPEPLTKEKRLTIETINFETRVVNDTRGWFLKVEDVKSAVEWLLKDIDLTDLEWVVYEDGKQKRMSEKERKQILRNLIKKAFKGVIDG